MILLIDTSVLVDILEDDADWAEWSIRQLCAQSKLHRLAIDSTRPALFLAGKAFVRYRRQGGTKSNVLGDFFIGTHAAVSAYPVLTRDTRRYTTYFPSVVLIAPEASV